MFSFSRIAKVGYVLALGASVCILSRPAPVQAQRTIAYPFLPGAMTNALQMSLLAGFSGPFNSYMSATQMLMQAGIPAGMSIGGGGMAGMGGGGGMMGLGGGGGMMGMGGGMMGMGGGMGGMMGMGGGMGGNMMGMGGNMMGMGGMGMGGNRGGMGGGGMGGMGGFAGKGFGGFNGKKPL